MRFLVSRGMSICQGLASLRLLLFIYEMKQVRMKHTCVKQPSESDIEVHTYIAIKMKHICVNIFV